jgi:integrase
MPKITPELRDTQIRNAKPRERAYKLYDTRGLRLLVRPTGTKVWQLPYKIYGKYNIFTLGQYPELGAADARRLRDDLKKQIKTGEDPNRLKKALRAQEGRAETTFEAIAREWHCKQTWDPKHALNIIRTLEADVFPKIGHRQINKVTGPDIVDVLHAIESRKAFDVAHRVGQRCVAIFDYAIAKHLCEFNPAMGRTKMLKRQPTKHRPGLKDEQLPEFLNKLEGYSGSKKVKLAMQLLILTFLRPGELRGGRWNEVDEKKAEWKIPAERMKMKRPHVVPLSRQALDVLKELRKLTGTRELMFPGERNYKQELTDVSLLKCLKILGYDGDNKVVPHGMRGTASTILHEKSGIKTEVIEAQLAHADKNKVRAAYNHAEYLEERKQMMQWWGDYLNKRAREGMPHATQEAAR